jgi:hypothetical protein
MRPWPRPPSARRVPSRQCKKVALRPTRLPDGRRGLRAQAAT